MEFSRFGLCCVTVLVLATPVLAQFTDKGDNYLRRNPVPQNTISFGEIRESASRKVGGTYKYVGAQYDERRQIYKLRFIQNGVAVDVYVDARTGQFLRRGGN
jgi:uncharacterized membrane protein YkoI